MTAIQMSRNGIMQRNQNGEILSVRSGPLQKLMDAQAEYLKHRGWTQNNTHYWPDSEFWNHATHGWPHMAMAQHMAIELEMAYELSNVVPSKEFPLRLLSLIEQHEKGVRRIMCPSSCATCARYAAAYTSKAARTICLSHPRCSCQK